MEIGIGREIVEAILNYTEGKGQIPDLPRFFIMILIGKIMQKKYGIVIRWENILEYWSINAPAPKPPLWKDVVKDLSQINTKTEIITQLTKRRALE